jgi:CHAT domain-containing protein
MAFTLSSNGEAEAVDLGEGRVIDSLVGRVRSELSLATADDYGHQEGAFERRLSEITLRLYNTVFAPLVGTARAADHILISPYGELNLLPFAILTDSEGAYVIEGHEISYLSSGRDLLKFCRPGEVADARAVVLASPDYESRPVASNPIFAVSINDLAKPRLRGPSDISECLAIPFDPLPSTRAEGETTTALLRKNGNLIVDYFDGSQASEAALKNLGRVPRVLHLATHGYYCPKARFSWSLDTPENPLLYSGLALAGANRMIIGETDQNEKTEDGILTSLEVSALNLVGTDLVVLSACQSGVGEDENSEGIFGLRRAFQQAGARTIVMSLLNVPDAPTADLMERFYRSWLSGSSKSAALRKAALGVLQERREKYGFAHPLYWGGFILVGDPN